MGYWNVTIFHSRGLVIDGVEFLNFNHSWKASFTVANLPGDCNIFEGGFGAHLGNMTYTNSPSKVKFGEMHEFNLHDLDGSFCGTPGCSVSADFIFQVLSVDTPNFHSILLYNVKYVLHLCSSIGDSSCWGSWPCWLCCNGWNVYWYYWSGMSASIQNPQNGILFWARM